MKRLFWIGLLLALLGVCAGPAKATERAWGFCELGAQQSTVSGLTATPDIQASYPACTVTVYLTGTLSLATIYSDSSSTPLANPFTASGTTGYWYFYANSGRYDVTISGAGISSPFTFGDVLLSDPGAASGLLVGIYDVATYSATPAFSAAGVTTFQMTLTGNVTSSTVTGGTLGQFITFVLCQDGTGNRTFAWPASFLTPSPINSSANACSNSTFVYDGTYWRQIGETVSPGGSSGSFQIKNGLVFSGTSSVLDCSVFSGSDAGAKINACLAALPSSVGTAIATDFLGATISTAVTVPAGVTLQLCGTFTQTATITVGAGASLQGCGGAVTLTKGANIDQVVVSGASGQVSGLTLAGVRGTYTGSGIVLEASRAVARNNVIAGEASDGIRIDGSSAEVSEAQVHANTITDIGTNGINDYNESNGSQISDNLIALATASSGDGIVESSGTNYSPTAFVVTGNSIQNQSTSSNCINIGLPGNDFAGYATINGNTCGYIGNSLGGINITNGTYLTVSGNSVSQFDSAGNAWTTTNALILDNGSFSTITGNSVSSSGMTGIEEQGLGGTISGNIVNAYALTGGAASDIAAIYLECSGNTHKVIGNFISMDATGASVNQYGILLQDTTMAECVDVDISHNVIKADAASDAHEIGVGIFNPGGSVGLFRLNVTENNVTDVAAVADIGVSTGGVFLENNYGTVASSTNYIISSTTTTIVDNGLQNTTYTFSALPSSAKAGSEIFCGDCTDGSNPCVGSGSGAWAVRLTSVATAWNCGNINGASPSPATFTTLRANTSISLNGVLVASVTAPTVLAAGCGGAAASIPNNNGTASFTVNVGTSNTGSCTITMPAAAHGWNCSATDQTTISTTVAQTRCVTGGTTSITIANYSDVAGAQNWVDSDVIGIIAVPY